MRAGLRLAPRAASPPCTTRTAGSARSRLWQRLHADGALHAARLAVAPADQLDGARALGLRAGLGDDWLRLGYLKVFMDGTLGSQTARLLDGTGVEITSREELAEIVRRGGAAGWPVAVHAIGDRANRDALDAFEETRDEWAPRGLRPRIEHAQLLDAGGRRPLRRARRRGVRAVQPRPVRPRPRRALLGRTGSTAPTRTARSSTPARCVANGSDAPIEELDPLAGIRAGVLRTLDERPAWRPEQARDRRAGARGDVPRTGVARGRRAAPRKAAPRLPRRPRRARPRPADVPPEELADVQVVATMAGGRWVHNPPPWD